MSKITPDRDPINKQAALQLSKGLGRTETVEEALKCVAGFMQKDEGAAYVRSKLESGVECVEYRIKIYKRPQAPGFTVRMYIYESTLGWNPIHFTDLL